MVTALERRLFPRSAERRRLLLLLLGVTALGLVRSISQPSVHLRVGGSTAAVVPADVAFLLYAIALVVWERAPLVAAAKRQPLLVVASAAFAAWLLGTAAFNGTTPLISAVKLLEPAVVGLGMLIVLDKEDALGAVVDGILAVTVVADLVGLYDYVAHGGGRVDSFLGTHDFAALATLPMLVVIAGLFAPSRWGRRTQWLAGVAAWLGLALTVALASLIGLYLGVIAVFFLAWRHRRLSLRPVAATLAIVVAVTITTLSLRHNDLGFIYKFVGKKETSHGQFESSWSQRLIYTYVGGRVFLDHPLVGTGWWGEVPPSEFARYVPAARRRFSDNPPRYFPPVDKPLIPQQTYDQVLYELGLVGGVLFLATIVSAGRAAAAGAARSAETRALDYVPALWFAALIGALTGEALFGGSPLATLLWLTLGLAAYRRPVRTP
jgi:hypothetical protein